MTIAWIALTLMAWGVAGIFDKKAVESAEPRAVFVTFHLFLGVVALVLGVSMPWIYPDWHIGTGVIMWEGLNAVAAMVAFLAYYYAMSKTQASWVLGITAGYPIIGQLLSTPLTGEPFKLSAVAAAALVSVGVALIGWSGGEEQKKMTKHDKLMLIFCVVLSTLLWGLLGIFEKRALEFGRPFETYFAQACWKTALVVFILIFFRKYGYQTAFRTPGAWKFSWLSAAGVTTGNIAYILALTNSTAGYVITMTAGYPLVMYVFALTFLKEKLNVVRAIGISLIVLGAVVMELIQ